MVFILVCIEKMIGFKVFKDIWEVVLELDIYIVSFILEVS